MIKTAITGPWRFAVYLLCAIIYYYLCYDVRRSDFFTLISLYAVLFGIYLLFIKYADTDRLANEGRIVGILFRVLLLFSFPQLSDDFYRYIWDSRIAITGHNPYLYAPGEISQLNFDLEPGDRLTKRVFERLNSQEYYSVYPPVCQYIFLLSNYFSGTGFYNDIWFLRGFIILFEIITLMILPKILTHYNLKKSNLLIYALNPMIIIELTGNIHFEAVMIGLLALAFYLLIRSKYFVSAVCFGFAIATKLLPLIFLPLLFRQIGLKRTIIFSVTAMTVLAITFAPFLSAELIAHFGSSIRLYFVEFEFNASIYYFGKLLGGWDSPSVKMILQKVLPMLTLVIILLLALRYRKTSFFEAALLAAMIYFFFTTTVHPWYISILIFFASIVSFRSVIAWSGLIFLTYITYNNYAYIENFGLIQVEYLIVFSLLYFDLRNRLPLWLQGKDVK